MIRNGEDLFLLMEKENFFSRFGLKRIGLFGSLSRGESFRDIDLLVEEEMDYKQLLEVKNFLEFKTGYPVDILQREYAEPVILHRAMKDIRYAAAS